MLPRVLGALHNKEKLMGRWDPSVDKGLPCCIERAFWAEFRSWRPKQVLGAIDTSAPAGQLLKLSHLSNRRSMRHGNTSFNGLLPSHSCEGGGYKPYFSLDPAFTQ
jgi:hypothetical protein